jgi:OOP family OmpA-OmpF porin
MNTNKIIANLMMSALVLILAGCAGLPTKSSDLIDVSCTNTNSNAMLKSGEYQKKVDNFLIIQDGSSTMGEKWDMKNFHYDSSKIELSKDLLRCLNSTLPDNFDANAGMRVFGPGQPDKGLILGMDKYAKEAFDEAVNSLGRPGGVTPVAKAIANGSNDLQNMSGNAAVIIFSDGLNTEAASPVAAATAMKELYGDKVCIYTVLLGNDPRGKATMDQITDAGKCGYATDIDTIGKAQGMDKFVTDVFLEKAPKKVVKSQPVVKKPVLKKPVEKISITLHFEFDFDKAEVRSDHHDDAKRIADELNKYSDANVELEGHTDSQGAEEYNMSLSRQRAEGVKKYLVEKFNINASRISTVGYGESNPVASNDTEAGRQKNRRVVANIE